MKKSISRSKSLKSLATTTALVLTAVSGVAQNVWNGSVSGDWGNAANWNVSSTFGTGKQITFHALGAVNLQTYLGGAPLTIGGLVFTADVDSDVTIRTYSNATGTGGTNRILTFDNSGTPSYITVDEGAEGNIDIAPGNGRTVIMNDLIINHNGSGLLTYHKIGPFIDDKNGNHFVIKEGRGTLQYNAKGNPLGGGIVIRNGRLKTSENTIFGTGTLTMTGGEFTSIAGTGIAFTNSYFLANSLVFGDPIDTGTIAFEASSVGTLISNTVIDIKGTGAFLRGTVTDNGMGRSFTKIGNGHLAMAAANTYSGGTIIGQGRLRIGHNDCFGTGSLTVTNATLSSNGTSTRALTNNYFFAHSVELGHAVENGVLTFSGIGTLTADTTLNVLVNVNLNNSIVQSGGDWSLTKTGTGVLTMVGMNNTFGGGLFVKEGVVAVNNSPARLGDGAVTLDDGTLQFIGVSVNASIPRDLIIGDNGGTLELSTNERYINWNKTLSGSGTLTKTGVGPLIIDATITHTGAVTVAQGLMQINKTYPQGGAVTVQSGGAIGGTGTIERECTIASGGKIDPGAFGIGTLTLDTLSVETNAVYLLEIDGAANDCVAVNNNLTLPESFNITVSQLAPAPIRNKVIFTYGGEYSGPQSAIVTADGDADPDARYEIIHVAQEKQVLFQRAPEVTIILVQ